jgi:O-antigen/teichoic acid export membrane protein
MCRLQTERSNLSSIVEKMVRYSNLVTIPVFVLLSVEIDVLIGAIYGVEWLPAAPAFICYAILNLGGNFTTPLDATVKALGIPGASLRVMSTWTLFAWGLALLLTRVFGFYGIPIALAIAVVLPVVWLLRIVRSRITLRVGPAFLTPAMAGAMSGVAALGMKQAVQPGLAGLFLTLLFGLIVYIASLRLIEGNSLNREVVTFVRHVRFAFSR